MVQGMPARGPPSWQQLQRFGWKQWVSRLLWPLWWLHAVHAAGPEGVCMQRPHLGCIHLPHLEIAQVQVSVYVPFMVSCSQDQC